jgi:hypothetical protein
MQELIGESTEVIAGLCFIKNGGVLANTDDF